MNIIHTITELRAVLQKKRNEQLQIGLVPTMGALHAGHVSLIQESVKQTDCTVVSIFVNPLQFGPNEDLDQYPRTLSADATAAETAGADIIFAPSPVAILGSEMLTYVDINTLPDNLCGRKRPGHFRGVCTIVSKLFNIVQPNKAFFGQKDIQQLKIIERMVLDLNYNIKVVPCPIVRNADGLALSSRNSYLSAADRKAAAILNQSLKLAARAIETGEADAARVIDMVTKNITTIPQAKIDYVSLVDENMQDVTKIRTGTMLALAVYFGKTRLIDNHIIGENIRF
ncbi:pantoate--beta-alanine ligase [bacterium]|nr:pantoate--beta-alanine ligase [bacterium]